MSRSNRDTLVWGVIILVIGSLFLLRNVGVNIRVWELLGTYWPAVLILIGVKNIFLYFRSRR